RARRRNGVRRRTNGGLHGEEVEQVFQEDCLLGNVVEAGENLLDVGSGPIERPRQEGETTERNRACQSPRQDHCIGAVTPSVDTTFKAEPRNARRIASTLFSLKI